MRAVFHRVGQLADDCVLQGGTITEDQDLAAIGITNEDHRMAIVNAAHRLPPVQPIGEHALFSFVAAYLLIHFV